MNRKQSVFPLIKACSMLVMACGWATLAHAQGPSFNCNKAQTGAERLICQDSKLSQLDRDIHSRYQQLTGRLDAVGKTALQEQQRAFLYSRNSQVESAQALNQAIQQALAASLQRHLRTLQNIQPRTDAHAITGDWYVESGGISITTAASKLLRLDLNRVDPGRGLWVCDFKGSAQAVATNDNRVLFASDDDPQQVLQVERVGSVLRVSTPQGSGNEFCGLNGSVVGDYLPLR